VPYVSKIRRHVVILDYFEKNDFWMGKQYLTLLTAFIPRSVYSDKPVVDGGRLVLGMFQGYDVSPLSSVEELPTTGWPEGNLSGYMNFGVPGFVFLTILNALLVKNLYLAIPKFQPLLFVYLSSSFLGIITVDPYSIFKFMSFLILFYFFIVTAIIFQRVRFV